MDEAVDEAGDEADAEAEAEAEAGRAGAESGEAAPDGPVLDGPVLDGPATDPGFPAVHPSAEAGPVEPQTAETTALDLPARDPGRRDDPVLDHDGPWSEEDYRVLTAKGIAHGDGRAELIDGTLVVGPGPTEEGEATIARTRKALDAALPEGLRVVGPVALRMGPDCVLVPDLVIVRAAETEAAQESAFDAEDVLMVVEIVGPEHGAVDRSFKPQIYARARLPYLLMVDHHVPFAAANMVISGRYHEYARASGAEALEIEEPFRLRMPLAAP